MSPYRQWMVVQINYDRGHMYIKDPRTVDNNQFCYLSPTQYKDHISCIRIPNIRIRLYNSLHVDMILEKLKNTFIHFVAFLKIEEAQMILLTLEPMFQLLPPGSQSVVWGKWPTISHIPQSIRQISNTEPFCNRNVHIYAHFCYKWRSVGYGTGALWDLWIWSIAPLLNKFKIKRSVVPDACIKGRDK